MPNTVKLYRVLRTSPEKLYRAFTDVDALVKWIPPYGFTAKVHSADIRPGGNYRMSFTNFTSGHSHAFTATFVEMVPNELLRYTDQFDDPNFPGVMAVTVRFRPVACGTELEIVQEGVPDVIPVESCYLGWQESLAQLANLVEPAIPG
jgi:uncharacterized protein YndB with AHSA1/START domain